MADILCTLIVTPSFVGDYYGATSAGLGRGFCGVLKGKARGKCDGCLPVQGEVKRRIVHALQKYVLNPPVKLLFAIGLVPPGYALLETMGRRTGKPRRTPVGDGRVGEQFWIVAEHGMQASYVRNIAYNPQVRVKVREGLRARWRPGTAHLLSEDDPRARQRWLAHQRPSTWLNAVAVRGFGTDLLTILVQLDPVVPKE